MFNNMTCDCTITSECCEAKYKIVILSLRKISHNKFFNRDLFDLLSSVKVSNLK